MEPHEEIQNLLLSDSLPLDLSEPSILDHYLHYLEQVNEAEYGKMYVVVMSSFGSQAEAFSATKFEFYVDKLQLTIHRSFPYERYL